MIGRRIEELVGKMRIRWVGPLVTVALVAGAATGFAQLSDNFTNPAAPVPGPANAPATYLQLRGQTTGPFEGDYGIGPQKGLIKVIGFDMGYGSSGSPSCQDFNFRKPTDRSTPLLLRAAVGSEHITSATFTEYQKGPKGELVRALQVKVDGGRITSVHHVTATTTGAYDDVTFHPIGNVTVTWMPSKVIGQFTCNTP